MTKRVKKATAVDERRLCESFVPTVAGRKDGETEDERWRRLSKMNQCDWRLHDKTAGACAGKTVPADFGYDGPLPVCDVSVSCGEALTHSTWWTGGNLDVAAFIRGNETKSGSDI